jgi:MtN3 and saliva related transmembrane protein
MSITLLGMVAGALTSCSFIPQAYKVIKTKRTEDISIPMYTLCTIGVFTWILYGILINDLAILLTNIVTFIPTLIILILTVKYHVQNKRILLSVEKNKNQ